MPQNRTSSLTVGIIVFVLVLITTVLVTFMMPELFSSTARVRMVRPETGTGSDAGSEPLAAFVRTECEVIQSEVVLNPVIEQLNLSDEWGRRYGGARLQAGETQRLLKRMLEIRPVPGTELVEIRAFSGRPDEAARIANSMAESYRRYQLERTRQSRAREPIEGAISHPPVEIVDRAMPGLRPVRPNKPLYLAIGIGVGLLLGAGMVAAIEGLAVPAKPQG